MSKDSFRLKRRQPQHGEEAGRRFKWRRGKATPWGPVWAVFFALGIFLAGQLAAAFLLQGFAMLRHFSQQQADGWLNNSIAAQFVFMLIAEGLVVAGLAMFLRHYKVGFSSIGLNKPNMQQVLRYLGWTLVGVAGYFVLYSMVLGVIKGLIPGFNLDQKQELGFNDVSGVWPLVMTFISLVILPPLAEELLMRGLIFTSLRAKLPFIAAAIITSIVFAAGHLAESASGLFWIGAADTFILSMVLCALREKTGSLWSGIGVHALKNGVAFLMLYVLHLA